MNACVSHPPRDHRQDQFCCLASVLAVVGVVVGSSAVQADDSSVYNRDIVADPMGSCFACHGADQISRHGESRLDQRATAVDGAVIVAGSPDDSEWISRVMSDDVEACLE